MNVTVRVWRQKNREDRGRFVAYEAREISPDASFLEMLEQAIRRLEKAFVANWAREGF